MNPLTTPIPVDESQSVGLDGETNPEPILLEDTEILVNDFLSPARLQEIAGRDDLENVTTMEMIVNTTETTMGNFGCDLPNLKHLKLSDSIIPSVRDIGTSLSHLNVLWMSCCGLCDTDGISSMVSLSELYLAYNDIDDISPMSFLENLEVLDLEGNQIADKYQFDYLSMLLKLRTLSISGNPVCQTLNKEALRNLERNSFQSSNDTMSYREVIVQKLPQLKYIDDERCDNYTSAKSHSSSDRPSTASLAASSHSQEDIDLINNAIKEGLISEEETAMPKDARFGAIPSLLQNRSSRPSSAGFQRPTTAGPLNRSLCSPLSRPQTAIPSGRASSTGATRAEMLLQRASNVQRPTSSSSGDVNLQDESSALTFGEVICGNPIKALRARKSSPQPVLNMIRRDQPTTSGWAPQRPATAAPFGRPSPSQGIGIQSEEFKDKDDLFLELREWRAKHEERMSTLRSDVQVLKLDCDTSSEEILLDSNATDSETDEILDLELISHLQDCDINSPEIKASDTKKKPEATPIPDSHTQIPNYHRTGLHSPPPKNLSPSNGASSLSPKSPIFNRSPIYSSSQLDPTTVIPILKGTPKTPTSPLQGGSISRYAPAPPKIGVPRPRTAADFRLRRSLAGSGHDTYVPLSSPMVVPQAKRQASGKVNP